MDFLRKYYRTEPPVPVLAHLDTDLYGLIHFSVNTFTNKEWGYGNPEDARLFNPMEFDADQIVSAAKDGGLKGIILVCKHHDGFCLWRTKTTTHNISNCPWRNGEGDMVREFFRGTKDLIHCSTPVPVPPARRLILLIVIATLPLFVVLPIRDAVQGLSDNMVFVGMALIVTGFLLFASDMRRKGRKTAKTATWLDAVIVGVGQAIATMPGISRSGMTITAGCFVGLERKFAVRFSFLLSIPAILGANILGIGDAVEAGICWAEVPMYLVGVVVAAVSGYLCIRLLKMIAEKGKFGAFAYYCWAVGALTLVLNAID